MPQCLNASMMSEIVNKVSESGLITLDLETFYPREEIVSFDLKEHLFMGLILKEKEFRSALQAIQWSDYNGKIVALHCSADAIVPLWAYMLVTSNLTGATRIFSGTPEEARKALFIQNIRGIDPKEYTDARVVIKGCGDLSIGEFAFVEITALLQPVVKSLMYGEPCSTVPVYKRR
jgi:hypothetical protein